MKIGIITHHSVHNHGAILQLNALKLVLEKNENKVAALDYHKNYDFYDNQAKNKYNISIKSIPFYLGYLKRNGLKKTLFNIKKRNILNKFKKERKLIGEFYTKAKGLDAVFIGADEVFSIETGLNPFFWGMGVPCEHIFSYAGSFGPTNLEFIEEKNATEFIRGGIRTLEKVSVRDDNSREIIKKLLNLDIPQLCDPVILYGYIDEKKKFKRPIKEKYIVIYAYDNNMNLPNEVDQIKKVACNYGYKIVSPGFYHKWADYNVNVDPIELLEYINYAEFVITDTFHGTVCSLIMNTNFYTKIRENANKLLYLLKEYNVMNRKIDDFSEIILNQSEINFYRVNQIIEKKQEEGLNYIDECLKNVN